MSGKPVDMFIRLERNIERIPMTGCWIWMATCDRDGYGRLKNLKRTYTMAHRASYEAYVGKIPDGLTIDHLCRVRCCINPAHLEPVTGAVNTLRGDCFSAINARKTHCKRGHEFTEQNTYRHGNRRICRRCNDLRYGKGPIRGEQHHFSKLKVVQVKEIRKRYVKGDRLNGCGALAREFSVSSQTIWEIVTNKIWKDHGT